MATQPTKEQLDKRRADARYMASVMNAYGAGIAIEYRLRGGGLAWAETLTPQWAWRDVDYRIKETT